MKISALVLSLFAASASAATIGSYESVNDVSAMTTMGPDLDAMGDALGEGTAEGLTAAKAIYGQGGDSSITFQSLSTSGSPLQTFIDYYGSATYGDEYIQAAFKGGTFGDNDFSGTGADSKEREFTSRLDSD
jgi:hypothetical protein